MVVPSGATHGENSGAVGLVCQLSVGVAHDHALSRQVIDDGVFEPLVDIHDDVNLAVLTVHMERQGQLDDEREVATAGWSEMGQKGLRLATIVEQPLEPHVVIPTAHRGRPLHVVEVRGVWQSPGDITRRVDPEDKATGAVLCRGNADGGEAGGGGGGGIAVMLVAQVVGGAVVPDQIDVRDDVLEP